MNSLSLYSGTTILQCIVFHFILELQYYNEYSFTLFLNYNITVDSLSLYS